jgi:hypothetical protein
MNFKKKYIKHKKKIKNMKYVKTFENFTYSPINEEEEIFKKIGEFFSGLYNKVKEKFKSWKDSKKKEAAEKIANLLEKNKDNPKVVEMTAKIQAEYEKLSESEKKQLEDLQSNESAIDRIGSGLDKAGIEELIPTDKEKANESALYESLILESTASEWIGRIMKYTAVGIGIATILYWGVAMMTLVGAGYIASFLVGAGMSAGGFSAIICAVLGACGITGAIGGSLAGDDK